VDAKTRPAGFADVSHEEAMRRARELIPFFRSHAAECEAARRLTPPVMEALNRNGLIRYLQPKAWGGMELPFVAYYDMPEMLSRGDISVGWTAHNLASHHRTVGWYDMKAQEEVWGPNPDVCVASGIAFQQGRGVPVEGGVLLSGEWNFSSGTDHSDWNLLACVLRRGSEPIDYLFCLVPLADYEVVDDWRVLGMRATSSKTVRCKDVFVPAYRTISMQVSKPGHAFPGQKYSTNPHYGIPISALGGHGIGGCLVGNARTALEMTIELVKSRSTSYQAAKMRDFQTVQLRIGAAGAKIDAAGLLLRNDVLEAMRIYDAGGTLDVETRLRYKRNAAMAAKLTVEAVDSLHEMAGANGIYDHYPLQRAFRDQHAAAGHFSFSVDAQLPPWGLVALGGEFNSPTL
jgi:3-hydroxy-9,10-secoandrosta-1,3,5(10)-triene-9,17-dione monooxygenase